MPQQPELNNAWIFFISVAAYDSLLIVSPLLKDYASKGRWVVVM